MTRVRAAVIGSPRRRCVLTVLTYSSLLVLLMQRGGGGGGGGGVRCAAAVEWYKAPSGYDSLIERRSSPGSLTVPRSFIVTSRPLAFLANNDDDDEGTSSQSKAVSSSTRVHFIPGLAKLVCKGKRCGTQPSSSINDDGFPGEAIPIDSSDHEYLATVMFNGFSTTSNLLMTPKPSRVTVTTGDKSSAAATVTQVHLLTDRPYLDNGYWPKWKRTTSRPAMTTSTSTSLRPTRRVSRRTTTRRPRPSTTTKNPKLSLLSAGNPSSLLSSSSSASGEKQQVSATTSRPPSRPSMMLPAVAAFSLMALPVAAAAVAPFFFAGKKKRRRRQTSPDVVLLASVDFDSAEAHKEVDVHLDADDVIADVENVRNEKFTESRLVSVIDASVRRASALVDRFRGPHRTVATRGHIHLLGAIKAIDGARPGAGGVSNATATTKRPRPRLT